MSIDVTGARCHLDALTQALAIQRALLASATAERTVGDAVLAVLARIVTALADERHAAEQWALDAENSYAHSQQGQGEAP